MLENGVGWFSMGSTGLSNWCDGWDENELEEELVWLVGAGEVLEGDYNLLGHGFDNMNAEAYQ